MNKELLKDMVGISYGSYSNKYNRAQKLIDNWDDIKLKMEKFIIRGRGKTLQARLAYGILLMMETGIRIGNEDSAAGYISINKYSQYYNKEVKTFGLTTLLCRHVHLNGKLRLKFLGKKQVKNDIESDNKVLIKYAKVLLKDKDKTDLFLGNDMHVKRLRPFLRKSIGRKYLSKDFRTAKVNLIFIDKIEFPDRFYLKSEVNRHIKETFIKTAEIAGHTPTVCKSKYVSPDLLFFYKETLLSKIVKRVLKNKKNIRK
jgi:DNA topoisomerase IB